MGLIPVVKNNDWTALRQALSKLASLKLGSNAAPTFSGLTLTGLTASRLISTDASKSLSSVSDLTSWIAGTANRVTVADDSDGTVTLSGPQDIHTGASPTFANINVETKIFHKDDLDTWFGFPAGNLAQLFVGGRTVLKAREGDTPRVILIDESGTWDTNIGNGVLYVGGSAYAGSNGQGLVGIGVTDPDTKLEIFNAGTQLKLSYDATSFLTLAVDAEGDLTIDSSDANYLIDLGDGSLTMTGVLSELTQLGIGLGSISSEFDIVFNFGTRTHQVLIESLTQLDYQQCWCKKGDTASGPIITLLKDRGASSGSFAIVQDDDALGNIFFCGWDGTDSFVRGASIGAFVDGAPGNNDMNGRLVFATTAQGPTPITALTLDSTQLATFASNILVDGGNIGITADTNLIQLADGALTVNGTLDVGNTISALGLDNGPPNNARPGRIAIYKSTSNIVGYIFGSTKDSSGSSVDTITITAALPGTADAASVFSIDPATGDVRTDGDIGLFDNAKYLVGTAEDASIYWNTTDLIINSENVTADDEVHFTNFTNYVFDQHIVLPKTAGKGIKVDQTTPTFGFADLLGDQFSKNTGGTKPTLTVYNGDVDAWQFTNGDEAFLSYHIPHDYVPGTDIHLHVHWSQNAAGATGGTIDFKYFAIYSKGHNQASGSTFTSTPITATFSSININDGGSGLNQYQQHFTEVTISAASATAALFDRDDFEPDGVIELTLEMDADNLTGTPSSPFIHYVDIHYQTTSVIGTKSRIPDFYT